MRLSFIDSSLVIKKLIARLRQCDTIFYQAGHKRTTIIISEVSIRHMVLAGERGSALVATMAR